MNGKAGIMIPSNKFLYKTIIYLTFLIKHLQDIGTKQLCQGTDFYSASHRKRRSPETIHLQAAYECEDASGHNL